MIFSRQYLFFSVLLSFMAFFPSGLFCLDVRICVRFSELLNLLPFVLPSPYKEMAVVDMTPWALIGAAGYEVRLHELICFP